MRTFVEPLPEVARSEGAAATLAASLRCMSPALLAYKGIADERAAEELLAYLDAIAATASP